MGGGLGGGGSPVLACDSPGEVRQIVRREDCRAGVGVRGGAVEAHEENLGNQ